MSESGSEICINEYDFLSSEGNGNIGSVFKARKEKQFYAIKMINKNQIENMQSFYLLMQMMEQVENTNNNVVRIYEFFQNPLNIFIAMQYCNQGNLLQYMCKQPEKRLDCFKAIELFAQILNGFKFLVSKNIQHRNLKPQNILMHNDKPKISDYGLYLIYNGQENKYQMREFLSPENYEVQSDQVKHLCDIWGLGILLFFMIFNTWPFKDFDDIRKYTFNKKFNLTQCLKEKDIPLPPTLENMPKVVEMLTEVFQGLFFYESKDRMNFMQLCKHQIFLKVKNFSMEDSILFYFHAEKNLNTLQNKAVALLNNINGLPGVSARSMYSGDVLDDLNSNDKQSILISTPTLQVKKAYSKNCSLSNDNQGNLDYFNQDQSNIFTNLFPNITHPNQIKLSQMQSSNFIQMSVNSELNQESPIQYFKKKQINSPDEIYSFQNDGHQFQGMLSSFGKKRIEQKKNILNRRCSVSPNVKSPKITLIESEPDFENTEEFDSVHKEINIIPQFCILKACRMVNFQFKPHQDEKVMKMMDSYSLSSVISIPRPFSYPEQDSYKRQIAQLYDIEIYRYRFIEETVRILKNNYNETPKIIDYQLLILAEHYALKNAFYIAKNLLQKVERNENFLKIESRDFTKYFTQQCHSKYTNILEKDLQRLSIQYYLTQTQLQNQGINQQRDLVEVRYFFFKRNSINQLQEINSVEESDQNLQTKKVNEIKKQQKQLSQQSTSSNTQQTQILNKLQETPSFPTTKNSPLAIILKGQVNESAFSGVNDFQNMRNEEKEFGSEYETVLDEKHIKDIEIQYNDKLKSVLMKLQSVYNSNGVNSDNLTKVIKLALRIAMCLRHTEVFDRNLMEQIFIFFEKNEIVPSIQSNNLNKNNVINSNNIITISQANMMGISNKISTPSIGQSMTVSAFAKNQKRGSNSQMLFSIETLIKWVNYCTKSEALKQIQILVKEWN